jgi:hypothetical protein
LGGLNDIQLKSVLEVMPICKRREMKCLHQMICSLMSRCV